MNNRIVRIVPGSKTGVRKSWRSFVCRALADMNHAGSHGAKFCYLDAWDQSQRFVTTQAFTDSNICKRRAGPSYGAEESGFDRCRRYKYVRRSYSRERSGSRDYTSRKGRWASSVFRTEYLTPAAPYVPGLLR